MCEKKIAATDMYGIVCAEMSRDEVHGTYENRIERVSLTLFVCWCICSVRGFLFFLLLLLQKIRCKLLPYDVVNCTMLTQINPSNVHILFCWIPNCADFSERFTFRLPPFTHIWLTHQVSVYSLRSHLFPLRQIFPWLFLGILLLNKLNGNFNQRTMQQNHGVYA